jgi:uncharacterized protein involved in exopolysaccharide biosynthesis
MVAGNRVVTLFDVARLFARLWRFWLGGAAVGLALAVAIIVFVRPTYRASVTVAPVTADAQAGSLSKLLGQFGGLAGLAGISVPVSSNRNEAVAVLKSQTFTEKFIQDDNLLPILFADDWDADNSRWKETDPDDIPTVWDGWLLFDKKIRAVQEDPDRGLVTVIVEWRDRQLAAKWANEIVARANQQLRERKLTEIEASLEFLRGELAKTELVELRTAIAKVMEAQVSERMMANVREEYAFRVLDPARSPDADRPIWPKKWLLLILSPVAGALLGFLTGTVMIYGKSQQSPP